MKQRWEVSRLEESSHSGEHQHFLSCYTHREKSGMCNANTAEVSQVEHLSIKAQLKKFLSMHNLSDD